MNKYTRYIIRQLSMSMLLITVTLTGIVWLTQSLRFIDLIVNRGLNISTFLYLSSLLLPSLLLIILPIALFCAVMYTYYKLIMDSELVVLKSAGINRLGVAKPALIMATGVTLVSYFIALYLMPLSFREFKDLQLFIRHNYASVLLQEGVFNTPIKGLTVYIDSRESNGLLKGILVHDHRTPEKAVTMMASQGRLMQTSSGPRFELVNGNRQEVTKEQKQLSLLYFDHYMMDMSMYTKENVFRIREAKERYLHELFFPEDEKRPHAIKKLRAEGHQRITWPFYNILLSLVGLTALLSGQFNRRGQWKRTLTATCLSFVFVIIALSLTNIIAKTPSLTPLVYLNLLLIGGGAFGILTEKLQSLSTIFRFFKLPSALKKS